ncbi:TetR/AcrR family transcriptional regulator [Pararhizobium polonicum]|uniref:TetR/AcrR family transcriptional regulator n=1 Tax=Pararhizobium polonicum TaxID=1612624 RepID=UPI003CC8CE41
MDDFSGEPDSSSRRGQTRQTILNATKELVALKGPNATTVRDITAASGANGAAVNYYFQSKDGLVRLATQEITADVNRERIGRLDALEAKAAGTPLDPREILAALIEPILIISRAQDGGSLYVRNVFQMRVDARAGHHTFGLNGHVARRFIDAICKAFPDLSREDAIWQYEFARGSAIHLLANLDPLSRRFEEIALGDGDHLPETPVHSLGQKEVDRVIDIILKGFGRE